MFSDQWTDYLLFLLLHLSLTFVSRLVCKILERMIYIRFRWTTKEFLRCRTSKCRLIQANEKSILKKCMENHEQNLDRFARDWFNYSFNWNGIFQLRVKEILSFCIRHYTLYTNPMIFHTRIIIWQQSDLKRFTIYVVCLFQALFFIHLMSYRSFILNLSEQSTDIAIGQWSSQLIFDLNW